MSRFAFYQEVRIARPTPQNAEHAGRIGVVVGLAAEPGEPAGYGIALHGIDEIASCDEAELEATGRQFRREDFYDDSQRVRVRVDRDGRGHPV